MIETPGFWWSVLFFLIALGPLVFLHELGHYLVGRWCGVKAEAFSIGFGQEIAGWTDKRGTRWKIGWVPLGGYVRFAGDMSAAGQTDPDWIKLPEDQKQLTFQSKPLWKRAAIVAAGPITNFLVAIGIFIGIFAAYGVERTPAIVQLIQKGSAAEAAGFQIGDRIVAVNNRDVDDFFDVSRFVELRPGEVIAFSIDRNGQPVRILAAPKTDETIDRFGNRGKRGLLGIGNKDRVYVDEPWYRLPGAAVSRTIDTTRAMADGLWQLITGKRSLKEMGGPIMIAKFSGQTATLGLVAFLGFVALVSINLGFINLLPIPMLDGGHLVFYAIEGVIRRPVPIAAQEWAFRTGFFALMALMLVVTVNDLGTLGVWSRLSGLAG
jgi:regulator of sigma E protease